jgi:hypothetical protein
VTGRGNSARHIVGGRRQAWARTNRGRRQLLVGAMLEFISAVLRGQEPSTTRLTVSFTPTNVRHLEHYDLPYLSAFRPRGVPRPTSKLSLRVPARMGRRETEHKGENSKGKPWPRVVLRPGRMRLQ